ncbi:disrupted in schizophrenia 1 protein-like [Fukomys damarensis]|uniref:disrupted in schizophrenia 1 protein-like n=1 Tax=Fukomys damarensis TaxID=885580 RepID=UPI001455BD7F|nr:disrupted in schizophrenia 1 protein-like [Fukomys damarensis]
MAEENRDSVGKWLSRGHSSSSVFTTILQEVTGKSFPQMRKPRLEKLRLGKSESVAVPGIAQHQQSALGVCPGPVFGIPASKSSPAPAVDSVGYLNQAQTSVSGAAGTLVRSGNQLKDGTRLPHRLARPCSSGNTGLQQERLSMDSGGAPVPSQDSACSEGARSAEAAHSPAPAEASGSRCPIIPSASSSHHETFTSSFSFIQLSLGSVGEHGEADDCLPSREVESAHRNPRDMGAAASSSDRPHEDPGCLSGTFSPIATQDLAQEARSSFRLERDMLSSLDLDTGSSSALGPMLTGCHGEKGSGSGDAHGWDALLRRWEPVLCDCLQSSSRQLEVTSLKLRLQKLQKKAIEDDDYDKVVLYLYLLPGDLRSTIGTLFYSGHHQQEIGTLLLANPQNLRGVFPSDHNGFKGT